MRLIDVRIYLKEILLFMWVNMSVFQNWAPQNISDSNMIPIFIGFAGSKFFSTQPFHT